MSEAVERRLVAVLNNPTTSPYGNPIPGLDQLGLEAPTGAAATLVRLSDLPRGASCNVVVRRLAEHVQVDTELIARLREAGVVPSARVTVEVRPGGVLVSAPGHQGLELPDDMAHAVQVERV